MPDTPKQPVVDVPMPEEDPIIDPELEASIKVETDMINQIRFNITKMIPKVEFPLTAYTFAYMLYVKGINNTQLSSYIWEDLIGIVSEVADDDSTFQRLWTEIKKVPEAPKPQKGFHPAARR